MNFIASRQHTYDSRGQRKILCFLKEESSVHCCVIKVIQNRRLTCKPKEMAIVVTLKNLFSHALLIQYQAVADESNESVESDNSTGYVCPLWKSNNYFLKSVQIVHFWHRCILAVKVTGRQQMHLWDLCWAICKVWQLPTLSFQIWMQ